MARRYSVGRSAGISRDNRWITYPETGTDGGVWIATLKKSRTRKPTPAGLSPSYYASLPIGRRSVMFSPELKKGSLEMLVLSLIEDVPRHGYDIGKLVEARSGGRLTFALPTLYPTLLRLENRGWIKGRWVERAGERERCFYRLTPLGRRVLAEKRTTWQAYVASVNAVMGAIDA